METHATATFLGLLYTQWWYLIMCVALLLYFVLDSFDLGVGIWNFFLPHEERSKSILPILPLWDANQVWLVVGVGALLTGFPIAFSEIMTHFYIVVSLALFMYVSRGMLLELRHKTADVKLQIALDKALAIVSLVIAVAWGYLFMEAVAMPSNGFQLVDSPLHMYDTGKFRWSLFGGLLFALACFFYGGAYIMTKLPLSSDLSRVKKWLASTKMLLFIGIFFLLTFAGLVGTSPNMVFYVFLVLAAVGAVYAWLQAKKEDYVGAKIGIIQFIAMFVVIFAIRYFPVVSEEGYRLAVSDNSLEIMLLIALFTVPVGLFYFFFLYRAFWGRLKETK